MSTNYDVDSFINKSKSEKYKHFDTPLRRKRQILNFLKKIENRKFVSKYRFHPFILFDIKRRSYKKAKETKKLKYKEKIRPIALTAHHDSIIYRYYGVMLSQKYEDYIERNGLDEVPTAYRKAMHISNITAAKEAIDTICLYKNCWIIKGDFDSFFDNIRHKILKDNLINVLRTKELSKDWQAVFKSLTKYRTVKKESLDSLINDGKLIMRSNCYTNSHKELGDLVHRKLLDVDGPNQIGIPQGTSLSACLANTYMINFDKDAKSLIDKYRGIYRRYSDDFVIVIPKGNLNYDDVKNILNNIINLSKKIVKLKIKDEKTKIFRYDDTKDAIVSQCFNDGSEKNSWFDYLGFKFNGKVVMMREKSVYRFHYKSKRMIKSLVRKEKNPSKGYFLQKKQGTMHYLTVNNEKYSMVGYARRANNVFKNNDFGYESKNMKQISKQINKNKKYMGKSRKEEKKKESKKQKKTF